MNSERRVRTAAEPEMVPCIRQRGVSDLNSLRPTGVKSTGRMMHMKQQVAARTDRHGRGTCGSPAQNLEPPNSSERQRKRDPERNEEGRKVVALAE